MSVKTDGGLNFQKLFRVKYGLINFTRIINVLADNQVCQVKKILINLFFLLILLKHVERN